MIQLWIPGQPKTKGSLDEFHQDTPASRRWRQMMGYALAHNRDGVRFAKGTAIATRAVFFLPTADPVTPNCGDVDKLLRNLLDAAQKPGLIYPDDVQVVRAFVDKQAAGDGPTGVALCIWAPNAAELERWRQQGESARRMAMLASGLDIGSGASL